MVLLDMNGGYTGESSSLLPHVAGNITPIRGGGGDPKEINLFGTRVTITDPSTGALTPEHETILSKLNFKDKDDTEKRNLLQAIYNEGCDTNATLDLKSGCSPMRGLVTALAMKLLENMSASTAAATTVGEDEGVVISMTIPIDKLNIALGAKEDCDKEVTGNPDTWCIAEDTVKIGMNNQLVEPLESIKRDLNTLKDQMQDNINKSIIYDVDVLEARYNRIIGGIDMLLADVAKMQGKICEAGGNAESTVSSTTWISKGVGAEENIAKLANVEGENLNEFPSRKEIESHRERGAENFLTTAALEDYEGEEEPKVEVSAAEQARINAEKASKIPVTSTTRRAPGATTTPTSVTASRPVTVIPNNTSSVASSENRLSTIPEENEENSTSNVNSQAGSEVIEGGMYRKKRTLPNKTRRKVRFGETPIIKLI